VAELIRARAQPDLADISADTEQARRAAYWLAVVLGNCRLRELDLGDEDGSLAVPVALTAGRRLATLLTHWSHDAWRLEERLDDTSGAVEINDLCFDLLEARMEAWAAFLAIDEAHQACTAEKAPQCQEFTALMDLLLDRMSDLDRQMQGQLDLLSLVAPYPLLDNWKRALGPTYAQALPWWLDGRLQEAAAQVQQDAENWLPRRLPRPDRTAARTPTVVPRTDPGQRLEQIVLSWRGDTRGQGAADLYNECREAVGPGARDLLPSRLLYVSSSTRNTGQELRRNGGYG
jgi:hypothetical protein